MRTILILMIRGYQLLLSPLLPPCCRFLPTCSEYSRQAIAIHGPLKGLLLTLGRLLRCHPFCAGGYDPVPETWPAKPFAEATPRFQSAQDGSTPATLNTHTT